MNLKINFALVSLVAGGTASGTLIGPVEYLSETDSPFASLSGWVLETFEDTSLNILGVSVDAGQIQVPTVATDSVDGDDGNIDGFGRDGHSWFTSIGTAGLEFTFDASVIGAAPTAAGAVWTDGSGTITFQAFDTQGVLIDEISATHADGGFGGQTAEDRFYGIEHAAGIGSIRISNTGGGLEVDHVQYAIPSPAGAAILGFAGALGLTSRRRDHRTMA